MARADRICAGENADDARRPARRIDIDGQDFGVRAIRAQKCGMRLAGDVPVGRVTALALDQPQIFKAGKMCAADIEQVVLVHDVDARRMLDIAAARSLLRWNSV